MNESNNRAGEFSTPTLNCVVQIQSTFLNYAAKFLILAKEKRAGADLLSLKFSSC